MDRGSWRNMTSIPREVQIEIFLFLVLEDIVRVNMVCTDFYKAINNKTFWLLAYKNVKEKLCSKNLYVSDDQKRITGGHRFSIRSRNFAPCICGELIPWYYMRIYGFYEHMVSTVDKKNRLNKDFSFYGILPLICGESEDEEKREDLTNKLLLLASICRK